MNDKDAGVRNVPRLAARMRLGAIRLDLARFTACARGRELTLTRMEFDLLAYLMQHAGRVISQEELAGRVLRAVYSAESSLVRVHMSHLRRKLGSSSEVIETVRGRGFRVREQRHAAHR